MTTEFSALPMSPNSPTFPTTPSPPPNTNRRRTRNLGPSTFSSPLNPNTDRVSRQSLMPLDREGSSDSSSGGHKTPPSRNSSSKRDDSANGPLDAASLGVLSGSIGGSFGPFPRSSTYSLKYAAGYAPFNQRDSMASSDVAIDVVPGSHTRSSYGALADVKLEPDYSLVWCQENKEPDDYLHEPDPDIERLLDRQWQSWSLRGWLNVGLLSALIITLIGLFGGWPIYNYAIKGGFPGAGTNAMLGWNIGGINGSGQVPEIAIPSLIDATTDSSVYTRTGFDGKTYNLVFSDEFNTDGRTFWPGDDPWWEAVDLHYWATGDLEWYDPDAITTQGGKLVITLSEEPSHGLAFRSGMLQSWNKFCFTGGYVEASMSMPGTPEAQGYWPGFWTMGNLGRGGYGSTNDGMWPYSYDSCDAGTLPNQTYPNGTTPTAAKTSGSSDYGGELSYLPGQRASACTCPGEDHPGPNVNVGRGAPEIDAIEAQVDYRLIGSASQSIQIAPMDAGYLWKNTTPYIEIWNDTGTFQNTWQGSVNQESLSVITLSDRTSYEGAGYTSFGYEYVPGADGRITWAMNETQTWQLNPSAIGPNAETDIGQRLIPAEPMSININLAISTKFQYPEWGKLVFPGHLRIDYVRVYQTGTPNIGCDPASYPTSDYINNHMVAYTNPNLTVWGETNFTWPKNSLSLNGCA